MNWENLKNIKVGFRNVCLMIVVPDQPIQWSLFAAHIWNICIKFAFIFHFRDFYTLSIDWAAMVRNKKTFNLNKQQMVNDDINKTCWGWARPPQLLRLFSTNVILRCRISFDVLFHLCWVPFRASFMDAFLH